MPSARRVRSLIRGTLAPAIILTALGYPGSYVSGARAAWMAGGVPVASTSDPETPFSLVPDGTGGVIVDTYAWIRVPGEENAIHGTSIRLQRVGRDGVPRWPGGARGVCPSGDSTEPSPALVAPDGTGGAFVAWTGFTSPTGWGILLQRFDGGGRPAPGWNAPMIVLAPSYYVGLSAIEKDAADGVYLAWSTHPSGGAGIVLTRIRGNASFAPGWPEGGTLVHSGPEGREWPALAVDPNGAVIVAWGDRRDEPEAIPTITGDIYARRFLPDGSPDARWNEGGVVVAKGPGGQAQPRAIPDGDGGAIIGWREFKGNDHDVCVERIRSDGTLCWGTGLGVPLAPTREFLFSLAEDGSGGGFVAWQFDGARLMHLSRDSGPDGRWPVDGLRVGDTGPSQSDPIVSWDGRRGAIIAWVRRPHDAGAQPHELRVQRVAPSGERHRGWPEGGVIVQSSPDGRIGLGPGYRAFGSGSLTHDGAEGAYVAWSTGEDAYLARVRATGRVEPLPIARTNSILAIRPNPAPHAATVRVRLDGSGSGEISLFDVRGRERMRVGVSGTPSFDTEAELDLRGLPAGVYWARYRDAGSKHAARGARRLVVLR